MPSNRDLEVLWLGDSALRVDLPAGVDRRATLHALSELPGVRDVVLTEQHVGLHLSPRAAPPDTASLTRALSSRSAAIDTGTLHVVRARYDGPDLSRVAEFCGLRESEVIARHASRTYEVRFVGFLPGFSYLSEVDPAIATPRHESPRARVPAGAIGIAGPRTGIYPTESPGGWNLIATAQDFIAFDVARGATLRPGDRVRFEVVP